METIAHKQVITRKPHKCWACAREFPKGSKLDRVTNVDGGEISSSYWCPVCSEYSHTYTLEDGVAFGELRGEEDWEKLRKEMELAPVMPGPHPDPFLNGPTFEEDCLP